MKLTHAEKFRRYVYVQGETLEFTNIVAVDVTKSGFHKLTDKRGQKFIVAPGWRYIQIDTPEWSF